LEGVLRPAWSALKIEDMICIISSVGQLRASTVRKYLKNSLQFSWLLEKVGIRGDSGSEEGRRHPPQRPNRGPLVGQRGAADGNGPGVVDDAHW